MQALMENYSVDAIYFKRDTRPRGAPLRRLLWPIRGENFCTLGWLSQRARGLPERTSGYIHARNRRCVFIPIDQFRGT